MKIQTTRYYDEFLRYFEMTKVQQEECNLGTIPHEQSSVKDDLMRHVHLYDVVNRKYAGFTQILLDMWYGTSAEHPYSHKLHSVRQPICRAFDGVHQRWSLAEWLYVFIVHRVTGSGINYAKKPSGYSNTVLPDLAGARNVRQMVEAIRDRDPNKSIYTSVGYQFPAFPKKREPYRLGGDYYLDQFAPVLANELAYFLSQGPKKTLRQVGDFMFNWNRSKDLRAYKFQYAAVIADIADFYPDLVDVTTPFYYGTNAKECISYLAKPLERGQEESFLDSVMEQIQLDTGAHPYDAEDVACDFIRWIENYVRPGHDYQHLDRDNLWNSSTILDHPFGRQKAMLELGLIKSFNELAVHPSDDYIISRAGMSTTEYKLAANGL